MPNDKLYIPRFHWEEGRNIEGRQCGRLILDGVEVGSYEEQQGGYLPTNSRKVRPTITDAKKRILTSAVRRRKRQIAALKDMLAELTKE